VRVGMRSEDERGLTHRKQSPTYVLFASIFARDFYAVVPTHTKIQISRWAQVGGSFAF
jgi:hypothetical protein